MQIKPYTPEDENACIAIFESNCPKYFDKDELLPFINWLAHQCGNKPAYSNSEKDAYFVIREFETGIVACGGFYIVKGETEARLAWGMVHAEHHKKGYGTALYKYREEAIKKNYPQHTITLGTSQHTFPFYQKMGMKVTDSIKNGYGPELDRYDMRN